MFVLFGDDDDVWHPMRLHEYQVSLKNALKTRPGVACIYIPHVDFLDESVNMVEQFKRMDITEAPTETKRQDQQDEMDADDKPDIDAYAAYSFRVDKLVLWFDRIVKRKMVQSSFLSLALLPYGEMYREKDGPSDDSAECVRVKSARRVLYYVRASPSRFPKESYLSPVESNEVKSYLNIPSFRNVDPCTRNVCMDNIIELVHTIDLFGFTAGWAFRSDAILNPNFYHSSLAENAYQCFLSQLREELREQFLRLPENHVRYLFLRLFTVRYTHWMEIASVPNRFAFCVNRCRRMLNSKKNSVHKRSSLNTFHDE